MNCILGTQHSDYKNRHTETILKTSNADLTLNTLKYLLLIITEVQYCNVFLGYLYSDYKSNNCTKLIFKPL